MDPPRRRPMPSTKTSSARYSQPNRISNHQGHSTGSQLTGSHNNQYTAGINHLSGVGVSKEEADSILQALAQQDEDSKKTLSRLVVERYLQKYSWYWPYKDLPNGPSLSKAWAYYEHVTLPRHFVGDGTADTVLRRAEPGEYENETQLYDWLRLKQSHLIEWGTGVDLYFISLRFFAALMLLCGIINLPSMFFYGGDVYNGDAKAPNIFLLKFSAVCTNTEWVSCSDCTPELWERDPKRFREEDNTYLRNKCGRGDGLTVIGFTSLATIVVVLVALVVFSFYLHAREVRFDEDKATTPDYSVIVKNPPPHAIDPDVWKNFFSQFATDGDQVTVVTVALNNDLMVRKLVARRIFLNQLRTKMPEILDLDDERAVTEAILRYNDDRAHRDPSLVGWILDWIVIPLSSMINMLLPPAKLYEKIKQLTSEIQELQEKEYSANRVFVTFETEEGQRTALAALKVGTIDLMTNRTGAVAPECVFDGVLLNVRIPTSPDSIRWTDLSFSAIEKKIRRGIVLLMNFGMITIAGFCIKYARDVTGPEGKGPWIAGILTSCFNSIIPQIIKILMIFEPHATEGSFQSSLYLNITIYRWVLTAGLAQLITPTTSTLGDGPQDLLPTTYAILLFDIWLGPLLRLSDWFTNIKKHIFAPRVRTQEEMNLSFQGTFYNFGERYTDFTKTLFVIFYYSALFPAGFFFGFLILFFQYFVDRFSMTRLWSWQPMIGSELAVFSRRYFFTTAALAACLVSAYTFSQFPYDNLCDDGNGGFVFCDQSWRGYPGLTFPPTPDVQGLIKWMTPQQESITVVFGYLAVVILVVYLLTLFGRTTFLTLKSICIGAAQTRGAPQHIDFSSNPDIFAYVPQIKRVSQPFPYLVCDIDDIDQGLVGWNDPAHSYDFYNLIFDVPHKSLRRTKIIEENTRDTTTIAQQDAYNDEEFIQNPLSRNAASPGNQAGRPIYSIIRHYPTPWQIKFAAQGQSYGAL